MKQTGLGTLMASVMIAVCMGAASSEAQSEAGTVAAVVGAPQVQRAGTWQPAAVGVPVFAGDRLRTGRNDMAKIVFRDDSLLDLAPGTELTIDKQVFDPAQHRFECLVHLLEGKVRAWVSEIYQAPGARYEVETPTAIAGVRATEFVALVDAAGEISDFVGVDGTVEVAGKLALPGGAVQVGPQLFTRVEKGKFPTAPQRLDDARFRQYLNGLDILGTGGRDGLGVEHPVLSGRLLAPQDIPVPPQPAARGVPVGAPQGFLAEQLSPDIATNTQPLLDYRSTPPGQVPSGSVKVGF